MPPKRNPHRPEDAEALGPAKAMKIPGHIDSFLPDLDEIDYSIVRTEVITHSDRWVIHIIPKDPKLLLAKLELGHKSRIRVLCESILPVRFPNPEKAADYRVVREFGIPTSACLIMYKSDKFPWAADYFRSEFPRLLAQGLAT